MKVSDLIKQLKKRKQDAEVYTVKDFEAVDDEGNLTDMHRLDTVSVQHVYQDTGFGFKHIEEVVLTFEERVAHWKDFQ